MSDATTSTDDAPAALPGDGLREGIVDALRAAIGEHLIDTHLVPQTDLWVRVAPEAWQRTGAVLEEQGFDYFCFLSAIDWMPSPYGDGEDDPSDTDEDDEPAEMTSGYAGGDSRFQVVARVTDLRRHVGVTVKADVPDSMTLDTWIGSYAGANWHERETHEMFGISFEGHPDLRNLYLPGEFEGFPLRKDFPLLARMIKPWPGIVDVEQMPADEPASDEPPSDATAAGDAVEAATEPSTADADPGTTDESTAADDAVAAAEATPPANPPTETTETGDEATAAAPDAGDVEAAEPAPGDASETARAERAEAAADAGVDGDGDVPADLGPGTTSESTDADPEAPTPGPPTEAHPDGLTPGDTDEGDRS